MPWLLVTLALALLAPPGAREGRRGNAALATGDATAAAAAYRDGLARLDDAAGPRGDDDGRARTADARTAATRAALLNNLGLALAALEQTDDALAAFAEALAAAPDADARARAAYNAGTTAARAERYDAALPLLRRALLLRPDDADARVNYELAARRQQAPPDAPPPSGTPPEPSAYARALKARADSLVAARQYRAARDVLQLGLRADSTVAAFQGELDRLGEVVAIEDSLAGLAPPPRP